MKKFICKLFSHRFFRFLLAGGMNAGFSYCCFAALLFLIGNKEVAVTLNLIIAVFFNYNTSARFVFKDSKMDIKKVAKFYGVYFLTYPINLIHLHVTVDIWGWNAYISQLVTFVYLPFITYFLQKKMIFSQADGKKSEG